MRTTPMTKAMKKTIIIYILISKGLLLKDIQLKSKQKLILII